MDSGKPSPSVDLEELNAMIAESRKLLETREWAAAIAILREIVKSDPVNPVPYDLLARAYDGMGQQDQAADFRTAAKTKRDEQWKRAVEAEIRGRHELVGNAVKREIP